MLSFFRRARDGTPETPRPATSRPEVEGLEERVVPAQTFTVTTVGDDSDPNDGQLSLREAINAVNADPNSTNANPDVIVFASGLRGTLQLTSGQTGQGTTAGALAISRPLVIQGPGANLLTVRQTVVGQRTFDVLAPATGMPANNVLIQGLTISGASPLVAMPLATGLPMAAGSGGISNQANLTLDQDEIAGNAGVPGGGVLSSAGSLTIRNSTVAENRSTDTGGGVAVTGGTALIVNSTIDSNTATDGAGVFVAAGVSSVTIDNSTITSNTATGYPPPPGPGPVPLLARLVGGGVSVAAAPLQTGASGTVASPVVTLQSDIIALNTPIDVLGTLGPSSAKNYIGTGYSPGKLFPQPGRGPLDLGPLALNGGTTRTRSLGADSVAIDQGSNPLGLATDQAGNPRVVGAAADIGAIEFQQTATGPGPGGPQPIPGPGPVPLPGQTAPSGAVFQAIMNLLLHQGPQGNLHLLTVADLNGDGSQDIVLSVKIGKHTSAIVGIHGLTGAILFNTVVGTPAGGR